MDSTACLVGPDAPDVDLPQQFIPARQRNMEEDNPITRHLKLEVSFVAARLCFFRLREEGTHAGMRHVSLNRDLRPSDWFTAGIRQPQNNRSRTHPDWFRRDLMLNRDQSGGCDRSVTARLEQGCRACHTGDPSGQSLFQEGIPML